MSEAFFVLSGTVLQSAGRRWLEAAPGDFLHVPPGGVHAFRNPDGPASMRMLFTAGAPRQAYFEELASLMRRPGKRDRGRAHHGEPAGTPASTARRPISGRRRRYRRR